MRRIGCVTAGFENRMGHVQVKDAGAESDLWLTANQKMKTSLYNCKEMNSYNYWNDLGSRFFLQRLQVRAQPYWHLGFILVRS